MNTETAAFRFSSFFLNQFRCLRVRYDKRADIHIRTMSEASPPLGRSSHRVAVASTIATVTVIATTIQSHLWTA
jgi:hypothetical protein